MIKLPRNTPDGNLQVGEAPTLEVNLISKKLPLPGKLKKMRRELRERRNRQLRRKPNKRP